MMDSGLSKLARIPRLVLDQAERHGMDRQELMRQASLDPELLADPDSRITMSSQLKLWQAITERHPDVAVGVLIGSTVKARQLGVVGYAMYYSRDLLEAFRRLARYMHIISEAVQLELVRAADKTTLKFTSHPALLAIRHPAEAQLAAMLTVAREITQTDLVPLTISLPSPKPRDMSAYRDVFRCPVLFDHPSAAIICSASQMRLPIAASDPTLSDYLDQLADIAMHKLGEPEQDFVDKIRRVLWSELAGGRPNLWRTASELEISPRTLQRRLRESGTSYTAVLEELRREIAGDLLANENLGVSDIAFLLGYSEPSAFQRAFRRWHSLSPRQFRSR
jgi:AraC-like DNA-binding protein